MSSKSGRALSTLLLLALQELAEALIARGDLTDVEPMLLAPKRFSKRVRERNTLISRGT